MTLMLTQTALALYKKLIKAYVMFLFSWQTLFQVSDTAMTVLFSFFYRYSETTFFVYLLKKLKDFAFLQKVSPNVPVFSENGKLVDVMEIIGKECDPTDGPILYSLDKACMQAIT